MLRLGLQPYLVATPWRAIYCQSPGLTISVATSSVKSVSGLVAGVVVAGVVSLAATFTGVVPLALFKIKFLALLTTGAASTPLLFGVAITLADKNRAIPKTTGLIDTDFQNADDIRVMLLTFKFRIFKLT